MNPSTISRCLASFRHGALLGLILTIVSPATSSAQSREPSAREQSLQAPKIFLNPAEAQYSSTHVMFQGIPGIERTRQGRLWACYFSGSTGEGGPNNYAMLKTSADDGQTWSKLKLVIDSPKSSVRQADPCLWMDPSGKLWLFWAQAYSSWDHVGVWAMVTENPDAEDPVWSAPRRLCEGVLMNKPIVSSAGEWLFAVSLKRELSKYEGEFRTDDGRSIKAADLPSSLALMVKKGDDLLLRGSPEIKDPADDYTAIEPNIVERSDGMLWMPFRVKYGLGESFSKDGGRTWTTTQPSPIKHPVSRCFARKLASGNLLLVKHGPLDKRTGRELLTAFISRDNGTTWLGGLMLDERNLVSYPDGVQAPDGKIYVIYDHGRYPSTVRELLMAVFTEADVIAGKPSASTRLKVLVNRALEPAALGEPATPVEPTDRRNSTHRTVKIGKQQWMLDNLNVEVFRNGDPISEAKTEEQWRRAGEEGRPAWCYYNNDPKNGATYGKLYNWFAVADPRGLAPAGWHIPAAKEWTELAAGFGERRKAGRDLKSTTGWPPDSNGTNKSGFTGLPGGMRDGHGTFDYLGLYGYWWSSTEFNQLYANHYSLYCRSSDLYSYVNHFKTSGFSVRCIKD